jgi:hypothetical protein
VNPARLSLVVLATVVIFAAGVVTGGLLVRKTSPRPMPVKGQPFWGRFEGTRRAVDELERAGDLTFEQRVRIDNIIRDSQELIAEYFGILEPDVQQVFRKMREDIHAQLTSEQRGRFEELAKRPPPMQGDHRRLNLFRGERRQPGLPPPEGEGMPLPPPRPSK